MALIYGRHKFDGTITNGIVYPLMRPLYGNRVRQPIAGGFGFSGSLAKFYLTKDIWDTDVGLFGIDNRPEWVVIPVKRIKDLLASE